MYKTKDGVVRPPLAKQSPTSKKETTKVESGESKLHEVMEMFESWRSYRRRIEKEWIRDNKLYNNQRVTDDRYKGVSDTFVPMAFSTVETISSAIVSGDLNTDFIPQDIYKYIEDKYVSNLPIPEGITQEDAKAIKETYLKQKIQEVIQGGIISEEDIEALNALYDYFWYKGDWDEKLEKLVNSGLRIGTGAWWLSWDVDHPKLETVPFPDYIFDPHARDDESCRYTGRRYLADLETLKEEMILDPETGENKKRFHGLEAIDEEATSATKAEEDKTDKELKEDMMYISTTSIDQNSGQVEVIELVVKDRLYTVVNRKVLAEDIEHPVVSQAKLKGIDIKQFMPGITWANYKDESLLVGKSEISTFWKEQERLNDVTNQKSDAITRALLQNYRVDPSLKSQAKALNVPGGVVFGQSGQYEVLDSATVPNAAFTEEASIKNNIREATATDQVVKGVGSTSDITATEANLQVAQSGQRIERKIKSIERGPLRSLARKVFLLIRLFIDDPLLIPTNSNKGIMPKLFDPRKYTQDFEPRVVLNINHKQQMRAERETALQAYTMLIQDPTNNLEEVKKALLPKIVDLDKAQIDLITTQAPQQMGAMSPMGAEGVVAQSGMPMDGQGVPPEMAQMSVGMPA